MPDEFDSSQTPQSSPQQQSQGTSQQQGRAGWAAPPPPPSGYGAGVPYAAYGGGAGRSAWFYVAVIVAVLVAGAVAMSAMLWGAVKSLSDDDASSGFGGSGQKIGVIDVDGVILDAEKLNAQIRKFGDDGSVKAIVLHINSPGGGAAASQEIYQEVKRVREEKKKPIVASVESVGASGAYYIASACDKIYANDASVVGSIGVIMEWTNYGDLMRWAKLKSVVIHAGELKDAGDPTREMTPKEEAYFQSLVDNMYAQFVHDVAVGRHTTDDAVRPLATGQVWTGEQAMGLKLIDKVGGFRVALMDTAKQVGISGEPTVVKPVAKKSLLATLTEDADSVLVNPTKMLDQSPGFYFVWR